MAPIEPSQPPASTPPPPSDPNQPAPYHGTLPVIHNAALVVAALGPIGLLLPGRTRGALTLQNVILGGSSAWALNQLSHDFTGTSIATRSRNRWNAIGASIQRSFDPLPTDQARRNAKLMDAERIKMEASMDDESRKRAEMARRERAMSERGIVGRLWMGDEEEGWKEKRMEEERKALESGKGYWDMISEQIAEVWRGKEGGKKDGEEKGGEGKK
ncbi:putative rhomboid family membrane protein [Podospora aff. communis PSN243]|uniref:Rhomboid family membrane protein n=1 Tax=Podospora aff. communis PSN243 TaxID=3040156 RepID=A0AAV9GJN9_9PEZI|nr:putative rhomboid family membrane protein [Podospora aff. communis PSN243]